MRRPLVAVLLAAATLAGSVAAQTVPTTARLSPAARDAMTPAEAALAPTLPARLPPSEGGTPTPATGPVVPVGVPSLPAFVPQRPHVLVVSIDGCRPDCLLRADAPTIRDLMRRGTYTLWATTTDVAITTPSHVSMMTGVVPRRHKIDFNADPPPGATIAVPTLFDLAHAAGRSTALVSGKRKFELFERTHSVDHAWLTGEEVTKDERQVAEHAAAIIRDDKPEAMLVHFGSADAVGHAVGWGTPEQLEAIARIDAALAIVLKAIDDAGLRDSTYVIVTADHGGTGRTHGAGDDRSHFIPWICVGPGVRENFDLTRAGKEYTVKTYDTFATACWLLRLPIPADSDGRPVALIFRDAELMK